MEYEFFALFGMFIQINFSLLFYAEEEYPYLDGKHHGNMYN